MTKLTEQAIWPDGIYQIETTDPVLGGPPNPETKAGLINIPLQELASRTAFLREAISAHVGIPGTIVGPGKMFWSRAGTLMQNPTNADITIGSPGDYWLRYDGFVEYFPAFKADTVAIAAPVGAVMAFAMPTRPNGWIECNGAAISRTAYPALFAAIGTTYGAGDGSTTFNLPDLRGEFLRGWDHGRGVDGGRNFGTAQGDAIRNIAGQLVIMGVYGGPKTVLSSSGVFSSSSEYSGGNMQVATSSGDYSQNISFDAADVVPTASENRPRNVALMFCIKY